MIFSATKLKGAYIINLEPLEDRRGFFARCWCRREFEANGLVADLVQCNISYNLKRGTLRGMHYQAPPHQEVKLVRCTRGAIYDVILDLRKDSKTKDDWIAVELSAENRRMLYVPAGFAHGFQTLEEDTEVFYQMSEYHSPAHARTIRWNDAGYAIQWPETEKRILSDKDGVYP